MKDRFGIDWSGYRGTFFWKRPQLSRRLFFRHAASAVGGYFLMPGRPGEGIAKAAGTPIGTARNVVFVLMAGGPSHSDTFDLKEGPWTPGFMAPATFGDVRFPQGLMPKIAEQMESVAFLRSVRSWAAVHDLGRTWIQIGRNPVSGLSRIAPHIGSVASLELSDIKQPLPAFVSLNANSGPGQGYLEPRHAPFYIAPDGNGLRNTAHPDGVAAFDRRFGLLQDLDTETKESGLYGASFEEMAAFHRSARFLMYNSDVDRIFRFDAGERTRYGNTAFGNACVTTRNLLRARMGTRFVQITLGSWDHHSNIYAVNGPLQTLSRQFDNGLGTLIADLRQDGLLDETLIIAMGEFGRTVGTPNNQGGRDHFLQQSVLMAGAKIRGSRAIGSTDERASLTAEPGWSQGRDIRAEDIEATIYSALGIDWTYIRRDDPFNRGFEYVPQTGPYQFVPVHELW